MRLSIFFLTTEAIYKKEVETVEGLLQGMEEQNVLSPVSTASSTPVFTSSEQSLKPRLIKDETFKINMEHECEEKPKGNLLTTAACSQITPNSQHGNALDSSFENPGVTNPLKMGALSDQFEITATIPKKPSIGSQAPSCLSAATGPPPDMPGLIPIQQTQSFIPASSRFSPPPSSSFSASQFPLPDLVQVSSDSGSIDSHGNAGRCREYRKKRKRVLSECERDLAKMVAANEQLKQVAARLEHRVGKLKAFYIHSVLHSKYKCLNSVCMNLEK